MVRQFAAAALAFVALFGTARAQTSLVEKQLEARLGRDVTPLEDLVQGSGSSVEFSLPGTSLVYVVEEPTGTRPHYEAFVVKLGDAAFSVPPMHVRNTRNNVPLEYVEHGQKLDETSLLDPVVEVYAQRMPRDASFELDGNRVYVGLMRDVRFAGSVLEQQPDGTLYIRADSGSYDLAEPAR